MMDGFHGRKPRQAALAGGAGACLIFITTHAAGFTLGQRVQTSAAAEVRAAPSTTLTTIAATQQPNLLGSQPLGRLGSVVGGPKVADGQTWWRIDHDSGVDGWSIESVLQNAAPDTTPPGVVGGLNATAVSPGQVNLAWARSTDNAAAGIVQYEVLRNGTVIATTASTNFQDTGLAAGTAATYAVRAVDVAGNRAAASPAVSTPAVSAATTHPLDAMAPGTWLSVPNSRIDGVQFQWPPSVATGTGPPRYMTESSGAYDTRRRRFIIWGGGHNDYAGNEIYTFDIATLAWRRETEPTMWTDVRSTVENTGYYPDAHGDVDTQQPRSRHSYDYIAYLPNVDRFCSFGFFAGYPASRSGFNTDCFDFEQRRWERRADIPAPGQSLVAMAAYDPIDGHVLFYRGAAPLSDYDPLANRWVTRSTKPDAGYFYDATAVIDTKRHRFVAMGLNKLFWYDLQGGPGTSTQHWVANDDPARAVDLTSGDKEILRARRPGFAYDPVNDVYVAWSGESGDTNNDGVPDVVLPPEFVWVIDPDTWVARKIAPAAGNTAKPRSPFPLSNGFSNSTFGRFAYLPDRNVFILVNNRPDENVFFYKLDPASVRATPAPSAPFDFSLRANGPLTVAAGQSVNLAVNTTLLSGTAQGVTFEAGSLPPGVTVSPLGAASCLPPCSAALGVRTSAATPVGSHTFTVTGSSGALRHGATVDLVVQAAGTPATTPADPGQPGASPTPAPSTGTNAAGGGCTVGGPGGADATLAGLLLLASAGLAVRRRRLRLSVHRGDRRDAGA